jgi:hypothetical protein
MTGAILEIWLSKKKHTNKRIWLHTLSWLTVEQNRHMYINYCYATVCAKRQWHLIECMVCLLGFFFCLQFFFFYFDICHQYHETNKMEIKIDNELKIRFNKFIHIGLTISQWARGRDNVNSGIITGWTNFGACRPGQGSPWMIFVLIFCISDSWYPDMFDWTGRIGTRSRWIWCQDRLD